VIHKLSPGMVNKLKRDGIDIYESIQNSFISNIVTYILDSRYRDSIKLSNWIQEQVKGDNEIIKKVVAKIPKRASPDDQMIEILKYVRNKLTYRSDQTVWRTPEMWQKAEVTATIWTGDCEDGAILMYILAIKMGIKIHRLHIWAGWVKQSSTASTGGHCCLFYKPTYWPYNFMALDWCYYPSNTAIKNRNLLFLDGKEIYELDQRGDLKFSYYRSSWFLFNEEKSYSKITMTGKLQ